MTKSKKFIISTLAFATIAGTGLYGINKTFAEEDSSKISIVERIAEKFNLNKDDVQKVFDEEREDRQSQMKTDFEERLSEAVSKGDLTEEKKQLIIDKMESLQSEREENMKEHREEMGEMKNLSQEEREAKMKERREEMEQHRKEIEDWAQDNGIDMKYLMFGMGPGRGEGMGFHGKGPKQN